MNKKRIGLIVAVVLLIGAAGALVAVFVLGSEEKAMTIASGSTLEDARKLSEGSKDACLQEDETARAAVKADDTYLDESEEFSSFELTAAEGIIDVPAGTYYNVKVQRYDDTLAQGAILYDDDYGTYNYTIEKTEGQGEWRFVSMTACNTE